MGTLDNLFTLSNRCTRDLSEDVLVLSQSSHFSPNRMLILVLLISLFNLFLSCVTLLFSKTLDELLLLPALER